jgi:hypothetical protein
VWLCGCVCLCVCVLLVCCPACEAALASQRNL